MAHRLNLAENVRLIVSLLISSINGFYCMQTSHLPNSPQLLKVSELAALLKVKPRTIYEMVAQKRIPYRKPPGSNILRFDLDEIIAWTKAGNNK